MNRLWTLNSQSNPPAQPTSLEVGYPRDTGGATTPGYWWYYMITETLLAPVLAAGLTASNSDVTQLTQAIIALAKANVVTGALKPVRVIDTSGSQAYTGLLTIDGVALANGDRVLRNGTTTQVNNGVWIVNSAGAWTRATDVASGSTFPEGTIIPVSEGTANANTLWLLNAVSGEVATIGTTSISFTSTISGLSASLANYLTTATAASTYLTQANAASTYLTQANAATTYLTQTNAASTYLTQTNAANTYDTITARTNALAAYLTTATAASTYDTPSARNAAITAAQTSFVTCRVCDTGPAQTYSGLLTIDGVALANGDRVLCNIGSRTSNGIFVVNSGGAWSRAPDLPTGSTWPQGMTVSVSEGAVNANSIWVLNAVSGEIATINTTVISFSEATASSSSFPPCRVVDTVGNTLTGALTVDGIAVATGDRVLRATGSQALSDGIYVANTAGAWTRASDMLLGATFPEGMSVAVSEGTANAGTVWLLVPSSGKTVTVGTTTSNWYNILSPYLTSALAASTYDTPSARASAITTALGPYLTSATASSTYLTSATAASTYATQTSLSNYLTTTTAASTYLTQANATSTYLSQSTAASTYQTQSGMSAYLTTASASSTYLTQANAASTYDTPALRNTAIVAATNGFMPCRVVDTIGVSLNGAQTVDGVTLVTGDRVLRTAAVSATTGIYIVNTGGAWTRDTVMAAGTVWPEGMMCAISEGTVNANTLWSLVPNGTKTITIGTTSGSFVNYNAGYLTTASAASTYQTQSGMSAYLTTAAASSTYLTQSNATSTYLTISNASSTYLTQSTAASTYLTQSNASSTYATIASLSAYLTTASASSTYLTQANAASTYSTQASTTSAIKAITNVWGSARVVDTVGSQTYTGLLTIDGVTLVAGDRVLRNSTTTPVNNGVWIAGTGAWTRATDVASGSVWPDGQMISVTEGTADSITLWIVNAVSGGSVTIGTTSFTLTATTAAAMANFSNYLTTSAAASTYLTISNAASTYDTPSARASAITTALGPYLTSATASSTYLTISNASSTYLTQSNASSTYLTQSNASSTYLTISTAASTYQTQAAMSNYLTTSSAAATYATQSYVTGNPQMNSLGVGVSADGTTGNIRATGIITGSYSDDRLKERVGVLEDPLDIIDQFEAFLYTPNEYARQLGVHERTEVGLSAQTAQKYYPLAVHVSGLEHTPERAGEDPLLTLRYERFVPLLIEGIKTLRHQRENDQTLIRTLTADVERLINTVRSLQHEIHDRSRGRIGGDHST